MSSALDRVRRASALTRVRAMMGQPGPVPGQPEPDMTAAPGTSTVGPDFRGDEMAPPALQQASRELVAGSAPYVGAAVGSAAGPLGVVPGAVTGGAIERAMTGEPQTMRDVGFDAALAGGGQLLGRAVRFTANKLLGLAPVKKLVDMTVREAERLTTTGRKAGVISDLAKSSDWRAARDFIRKELDTAISERTTGLGSGTPAGVIAGVLSTMFTGHDPLLSAAVGAGLARWSPQVAKTLLRNDDVLDLLLAGYTRRVPWTDVGGALLGIAGGDLNPELKAALGDLASELVGIGDAEATPIGALAVQRGRAAVDALRGAPPPVPDAPPPLKPMGPPVPMPASVKTWDQMVAWTKTLTDEQLHLLDQDALDRIEQMAIDAGLADPRAP